MSYGLCVFAAISEVGFGETMLHAWCDEISYAYVMARLWLTQQM